MPITWPKLKLADCVDLLAGFPFKSEHFSEKASDVPLVKGENIGQGRVLWDISKRWAVSNWEKMEKFHLLPGDVVVAMDRPWVPAGLKWSYIRADDPKALLVQRVVRLRTKIENLDQTFLRFIVGGPQFENYVRPVTTGVNVPHISGQQILDFEFNLPPLSVQRRIAAMLSAYDDLIENNLRRIKILEEMARALYREWFVEFRFPGHTKIPRVASAIGPIPKGWELSRLGDNLSALETGTRPKGGVRDEVDGVPSIGAENIDGIGRHKYESEKFVSREFFRQMKRGIVRDRDVAIYKDGAYIGKSSYFRDGFPHVECCVNEHVFLLRTNGAHLTQNILYLWLQDPDTLHAIRATNANAAQPGINQQSVNGLLIVLPDPETAQKFEMTTEPLFADLINLAKQNQNLRRTRDLLLPRLLKFDPSEAIS